MAKTTRRAETYNRWARTALVPATTAEQHERLYQDLLICPGRILAWCAKSRVALGCLPAYRRALTTHPDMMRELAEEATRLGVATLCPQASKGNDLCCSDRPNCAPSPGAVA